MKDMFGRNVCVGDYFIASYTNQIEVFQVARINKHAAATRLKAKRDKGAVRYFEEREICLIDEKLVTHYILRESLA